MLLLGNLGQQLDINDTQAALAQIDAQLDQIGRNDQDLSRCVRQLGAENQELKLYLAAVVRLLVTKNMITDPELRTIVDAIDRSDGTVDGKFAGKL